MYNILWKDMPKIEAKDSYINGIYFTCTGIQVKILGTSIQGDGIYVYVPSVNSTVLISLNYKLIEYMKLKPYSKRYNRKVFNDRGRPTQTIMVKNGKLTYQLSNKKKNLILTKTPSKGTPYPGYYVTCDGCGKRIWKSKRKIDCLISQYKNEQEALHQIRCKQCGGGRKDV